MVGALSGFVSRRSSDSLSRTIRPRIEPILFLGNLVFGFDFNGNNTGWEASATDAQSSARFHRRLRTSIGNLAVTHIDQRSVYRSEAIPSFVDARVSVSNSSNGRLVDIGDGTINFGALDSTDFSIAADTDSPTVTSIDDGDADKLRVGNEQMTYTISFSEDIDAASVFCKRFQ